MFLLDEATITTKLLPYWVTLAMQNDTELTFASAFEAAVDAAMEHGGDTAVRSSWPSAFMAMLKAIATGDTGEGGEIADLATAVKNADKARLERTDRKRRGDTTWRWLRASMPPSAQKDSAREMEWRVIWEQLIFNGYEIQDVANWIEDNGGRLNGKYPKEVFSEIERGLQNDENRQFSA